jgi:hypothetical protein
MLIWYGVSSLSQNQQCTYNVLGQYITLCPSDLPEPGICVQVPTQHGDPFHPSNMTSPIWRKSAQTTQGPRSKREVKRDKGKKKEMEKMSRRV